MQRAFALCMVRGMNPSDAYREAGYSCNMSAASIKREAYKLSHNPNIAPIIESGVASATEKAVWTRKKAIERLCNVNSMAYAEILGEGLKSRVSVNAFFDSLDRLNDLYSVTTNDPDDRPVIMINIPPKRFEDGKEVEDVFEEA